MPTSLTTLAQLPPPDLNPLQLFLSADIVVKAVMAILLAASVVTWTILLAKLLELRQARLGRGRALAAALAADSLSGLAASLNGSLDGSGGNTAMLHAATEERERSATLPAEGIRDRAALRLQRIEAAAARGLGRGVGVLASIGSCAPFIGLFGTVWGIMNAFLGISRSQTTNLAVVAPGIAEALLATAAGLVAAIPAVLVYNFFSRSIAASRAELGDLAAAIMLLLSRDLDRGAARPASRTADGHRPVLLRGAAE
jgi:biopolymer transport protein ExbB